MKKKRFFRNSIKKLIQYLRKIFLPKFKFFFHNYEILNQKNKELFFGYYDLNPFSNDSNSLLCHSVSKKEKKAEILLIDLKRKKVIPLDKTKAWSWQLGSRLRWINNSNYIGFNSIIKGQECFKIIDKSSKIIKIINFPLYDLYEKKMLGLSINFGRLKKFRPGYGYETNNSLNYLRLINLKNNKIIFDFDIKKIHFHINFKNIDDYYFNHLNFSKCGNFFSFFFIYYLSGKERSKLFICDLKKDSFFPITKDNETPSHLSWLSSGKIIITIVKDSMTKYYEYDINLKRKRLMNFFPNNLDGHPSENPMNNNLIVTDTYPDRFDNQSLFVVDKKKKKKKKISYFYNPKTFFGKNKCDLHPRWSMCGGKICCDTACSGKREIFIIEFNTNKVS